MGTSVQPRHPQRRPARQCPVRHPGGSGVEFGLGGLSRRRRRSSGQRAANTRIKCPQCWAEKAYVRRVEGWRGWMLTLLLLRPLKCHHCYFKFVVPWLSTIGKQIHPPSRANRADAVTFPTTVSRLAEEIGDHPEHSSATG